MFQKGEKEMKVYKYGSYIVSPIVDHNSVVLLMVSSEVVLPDKSQLEVCYTPEPAEEKGKAKSAPVEPDGSWPPFIYESGSGTELQPFTAAGVYLLTRGGK
jgi:hypothetical protein